MPRRFLIILIVFITVFSSSIPQALCSGKGDFTWPTEGEIITKYEENRHRGLDIKAEVGDCVVAAASGTVHWVGKTPRGEPCVSIQHEENVRTTYIPLESSVSKGESVERGQAIGKVSGFGEVSSSVSHLHFGIKVYPYGGDDYLDPEDWLPALTVNEQPHEVEQVETSHASADSPAIIAVTNFSATDELSAETSLLPANEVNTENSLAKEETPQLSCLEQFSLTQSEESLNPSQSQLLNKDTQASRPSVLLKNPLPSNQGLSKSETSAVSISSSSSESLGRQNLDQSLIGGDLLKKRQKLIKGQFKVSGTESSGVEMGRRDGFVVLLGRTILLWFALAFLLLMIIMKAREVVGSGCFNKRLLGQPIVRWA